MRSYRSHLCGCVLVCVCACWYYSTEASEYDRTGLHPLGGSVAQFIHIVLQTLLIYLHLSAGVLVKVCICVSVLHTLWKSPTLQIKILNHQLQMFMSSLFNHRHQYNHLGKKQTDVFETLPPAANTPENKTSRVRQTISSQPDAPVSLICWRASARWASQGDSLFLSPWTSAALFQRDPLTWNNPLSRTPPRLSTTASLFPSTLSRASSFSLKVGYSLTPYLPYSGYLSFTLSSELMTNIQHILWCLFTGLVLWPVIFKNILLVIRESKLNWEEMS